MILCGNSFFVGGEEEGGKNTCPSKSSVFATSLCWPPSEPNLLIANLRVLSWNFCTHGQSHTRTVLNRSPTWLVAVCSMDWQQLHIVTPYVQWKFPLLDLETHTRLLFYSYIHDIVETSPSSPLSRLIAGFGQRTSVPVNLNVHFPHSVRQDETKFDSL